MQNINTSYTTNIYAYMYTIAKSSYYELLL